MPLERKCPECGGDLANDELQGLCPRCIGRFAFGDTTSLANLIATPDKSVRKRTVANPGEGARGAETEQSEETFEG